MLDLVLISLHVFTTLMLGVVIIDDVVHISRFKVLMTIGQRRDVDQLPHAVIVQVPLLETHATCKLLYSFQEQLSLVCESIPKLTSVF